MALALSLKAERGDDRGLRALESELFADSERMSAVTASAESSFWALTAEQMVYLAECDGLALAESALFGALKRWCLARCGQSGDGRPWEHWMKPFVPLLRFPMMSTQSLLDDVLPVHGQLFAENDHFLHIVLYKMCAEQRQSDLDGPFPFKLCCPSTPRRPT